MPFSHSGQLTSIMQTLERLQPRSILDVGIGMGQYGFLARMNLEHLHLFDLESAQPGLRDRADWHIQIDGIEGFPEYITPAHQYVYSNLLIGDARDILPTLPDCSYDLVMAIDILEHFETSEGEAFLAQLRRIARRAVLISTPKLFIEQEVEANPLENHRSLWTQEQLQQAGITEIIANDGSWIMLGHVSD